MYSHPKTFTQIFTAALFEAANNGKQPRHLSTGEWLNKLVHPYVRILLCKKAKELLIRGATWMDPQSFIPSEK